MTGEFPLIDLKGSKTETARRVVSVHPDLMPMMRRRTNGKVLEAWLFDDPRDVPEGSTVGRSQPVSGALFNGERAMSKPER